MTFEAFQQLCNQAVSTGQQVTVPCPIVIGDGETRVYIGDTRDHHLIIVKTDAANPALQSIYRSVGFSFDVANNQTVIQPLTTGTGT
jgi:hypothetical protein